MYVYIREVFIAQVNNNKSIMIMTFVYKILSSEEIKFLCIHVFIKVFLPERSLNVCYPHFTGRKRAREGLGDEILMYISRSTGAVIINFIVKFYFFMWHSKETFLYSVCI